MHFKRSEQRIRDARVTFHEKCAWLESTKRRISDLSILPLSVPLRQTANGKANRSAEKWFDAPNIGTRIHAQVFKKELSSLRKEHVKVREVVYICLGEICVEREIHYAMSVYSSLDLTARLEFMIGVFLNG